MAEGTVAASFELEENSRGMIGSFCLETIVTDKLEFRVFEISAVVPAEIPTLAATMIRYIGKDFTIAVRASGEIRPANLESTRLYIV